MKRIVRELKSIKKWELALAIGVIAAIMSACLIQGEGQELSSKLIRLHVLANSDSPRDQELKLKVRDRVLELAGESIGESGSIEDARARIEKIMPSLEAEAERTLRGAGCDYPVWAELERTWFPTRDYGGFGLPAGQYEALRVVIGEGEGKNWWCVLFPPMCLTAATDNPVRVAAGLTDEQIKIITEDSPKYVFKFKAMEIMGDISGLFCN